MHCEDKACLCLQFCALVILAAMDPADVPQDVENIATRVSRPSEESGPPTPQQMVTGRSLNIQQQDQDHVQWPLSQEEKGPHVSEELCMASLSS